MNVFAVSDALSQVAAALGAQRMATVGIVRQSAFVEDGVVNVWLEVERLDDADWIVERAKLQPEGAVYPRKLVGDVAGHRLWVVFRS